MKYIKTRVLDNKRLQKISILINKLPFPEELEKSLEIMENLNKYLIVKYVITILFIGLFYYLSKTNSEYILLTFSWICI